MFSSLTGRRLTICGGAGFCGTHLALALKRYGAEVSVVDGFLVNHLGQWAAENSPYRDRYLGFLSDRLQQLRAAGIPLYSCDLRDYHETSRVLAQIDPQVLVHLAAISHAGKSNRNRYAAFDHSIHSLRNTLDFACGVHLEHFVYQSSSMVYGNFNGQAHEEDPLKAIGFYGNLKVAGEHMVIACHQVEGLPYTITRPSALYGPLCVSRRVVQIFIENCLDGQPLQIASEGEERLDFTYIQDWVQGMLLILAKPEALNQTFNLARGDARSLNGLVDILRGHFPDLQVQHVPRDRLMPLRDSLDCSKIRDILGYAPEYALERGIKEYLSWYRSLPT